VLGRLGGAPVDEGELAAPSMRLRLEQAERAEGLACGGAARLEAADAALGAVDHALEVVALERLLGAAEVETGGTRRLVASGVVLGKGGGVDLARLLEPGAGEPVAGGAILLGERGVGRVADGGVPEGELDLAREARRGALEDHLALDEIAERVADEGELRAPEQRGHAPAPERPPEDAGRAEHALGVGAERVEARLDHPEHGLGQPVLLAACGHCADQLLQVECVALAPVREQLDYLRLGVRPERGADQLGGGARRDRAESERPDRALRPEVWELVVHFRPRHRQHQEGLIAEVPERRVHELDRR
jgi:hypothetical protein